MIIKSHHTATLLATLTLALGAHAADTRQPYHCDNGSRIDMGAYGNTEQASKRVAASMMLLR